MQNFKRLASLALLLSWMFTAGSSAALAAFVYIGKERPAAVKLPANYDSSQTYPLLVLLHGYASGATETVYYLEADLQQAASPSIFLVPQGTLNAEGRRFWNYNPPQNPDQVNDSAYIQALIVEARERFRIDPARIYVIGISNGGFMAYRLACDTDGLFAGIVSIAGGMFSDASLCQTKTPISVLQIHGTKDNIVPFVSQRPQTLGAFASTESWAQRNGCKNFEELPGSRDLMLQPEIPGIVLADGAYQAPLDSIITNDQGAQETDQLLWSECLQSVKVGLWRVNGATHVPDYSGKNLIGQALDFFAKSK